MDLVGVLRPERVASEWLFGRSYRICGRQARSNRDEVLTRADPVAGERDDVAIRPDIGATPFVFPVVGLHHAYLSQCQPWRTMLVLSHR